jgi:adenylate cyclase, class 2
MNIEVEKKYRVTEGEAGRVRGLLREAGGRACGGGAEFEVNTLYTGPGLEGGGRVLRLRRVGAGARLTFKERFASESGVKRNREEEIGVSDPEAASALLEALGYRPALVYEKRRETWRLGGVEVVLDELPFGWFVEIEGEELDILDAERRLELTTAEAVHETYPQLTLVHGLKSGDVVEARFQSGEIGNV